MEKKKCMFFFIVKSQITAKGYEGNIMHNLKTFYWQEKHLRLDSLKLCPKT